MTALAARFQRSRWSEVRRRIDKLNAGEGTRFRLSEKGAVSTAITRTQDAYETRRYVYKTELDYRVSNEPMVVVRRIK